MKVRFLDVYLSAKSVCSAKYEVFIHFYSLIRYNTFYKSLLWSDAVKGGQTFSRVQEGWEAVMS